MDEPSAEIAATPRSGWLTIRSRTTESPSGSVAKPSKSMLVVPPLSTRPSSVSGSGARLDSAPSTVMRTVASSHSEGVPVVYTR